MEYNYYNQFHMSDDITEAVSKIISTYENKDVICKVIKVIVPEHNDLVYCSGLSNNDIYGQGYDSLSGAQIRDLEKIYGRYEYGKVPAMDYLYFVVMDASSYEKFNKITFKTLEEVEGALKLSCDIFNKYEGYIDVRTLYEKYPYLQEFFEEMDEWRAEKGRVTVDNSVIEEKVTSSLCKRKKQS